MIAFLNRHIAQPLMDWRAGSRRLALMRTLKERQYDPPHVVRARQFEAVARLLNHAYETVPHYRTAFQERAFHPADFRRLEDLALLPVLTKADVRSLLSKLHSSAYLGKDVLRKRTSGSTGVPLEVVVNAESVRWKAACTLRADEWSGWRLGQRVAKVWGNPEYRAQGFKGRLRNFLVDRARYLDTIGLDDYRMRAFAKSLRRTPAGLLFGHAHSLYLFACYVRKHFPGAIRVNGIVSTAMLLHDYQRAAIQDAFGCAVTNRYGCEEVSLIACECERHRGLHLNADSLYAEVVFDRPGAKEAGEGSLVVTDLTNLAMPIIRYKVGDVVVKSERACPCGRGLPLLERVEGREADYVLTPAGKLISGISLTENFALHIRGAAQLQIVQESERFLRLRLVAGAEFGTHSRGEIEALVRGTFGPEMRYEVELVDAIPQEASGKYRFCISKVASDYLRAMAA
jgi:phenylacetate-CoA ligase